jgi:hypothetical protein
VGNKNHNDLLMIIIQEATEKSVASWFNGKNMKRILFIFLCLFVVIAPSELYAQYCNNPTGVTLTRDGTNGTLSWTGNGSDHYYWIILSITPWGSTNWFEHKTEPEVINPGTSTSGTSASITGLPLTGTLYAYVVGVNSSDEWCAPSSGDEGAPSEPPASPPTVTTSAASSILAVSATLGGNVTADGGASVTDRGIVYSSSDNTPTIGEGGVTQDANGSGTGSFSESISGLSSGTTYYFQAYATNSAGTSYGGVLNFKTDTPPVANNDTYNRFYTDTGISFFVPASGVLGNDSDTDGNPLTVGTPRPATAITQGTLTLNSDGSFTYTSPNSVKDQTATFTYYANDGIVNSNSAATVTINIYTPRFVGPGTSFNDPANWNCGYVPTESLNIIIAAGQTMVINSNYTCKNLQFETGSSFNCTGGSTLTITGDVLDSTGKVIIDVVTSLQVKSSIEIPNGGVPD